ncbi:MAG: hydrolase [Bdellovibrionales bacterium]
MAKTFGLFVFLLVLAIPTAKEGRDRWVIWNVGQGQWVTLIREDSCWHFDMGGEWAPWARIRSECRRKFNSLQLSHYDWDHMNFVSRAGGDLPNLCHFPWPAGEVSPTKKRRLSRIPKCFISPPFLVWHPGLAKTSNAMSAVSLFAGLLLPGDSPAGAEKQWAMKRLGWVPSAAMTAPPLNSARWLILGHHGSRTSTSELLLGRLPKLVGSISSARRRRYGHPHLQTQMRLHRHRIPLLRTEDWGNIVIEMGPE